MNGMVNNDINYITLFGIPDSITYQDIANLYTEIFKDADLDFFKQRIEQQPELFSILAYNNDDLIGFKVDETTFYSWIGGVLPNHQQRGIAKYMAKSQEMNARSEGFTKLRTKSMNQYKAMIILNLKNGFDITKVYTNTKGQTKIVFEKLL